MLIFTREHATDACGTRQIILRESKAKIGFLLPGRTQGTNKPGEEEETNNK